NAVGFAEALCFDPYRKPALFFDVLQPYIRRFGFLDNLKTAQMAAAAGGLCIPHNWGAQIGLYMALHLAKVAKAVARVEDDRSTMDVIAPEGYQFHDGMYTIPEKPGLSIAVDEGPYRMKCKATEM